MCNTPIGVGGEKLLESAYCATNKYQGYDSKDGCEAGNDVWTGDSSDDKETGEAAGCSGNGNGEVTHGSDKEGFDQEWDIRWTLKVDRFGQRVRQSRMR